MDIIKDLQDNFRDEIDSHLASDSTYQKAEEELYNYMGKNLSEEKADELEFLLGRVTSAVEYISLETGMKIGAKIAAGLLK